MQNYFGRSRKNHLQTIKYFGNANKSIYQIFLMKQNTFLFFAILMSVFTWQLTAQPGTTCNDPIIVSDMPFYDEGNTGDYGNNYSSSDVPELAPDAVTEGALVLFYLNDNEVVYSYTAGTDGAINIQTTNDDESVGLWVFAGCPFESTVGYHTAFNGTSRSISDLPVMEGETYYIVISSWYVPNNSTDYTISIEGTEAVDPPTCLRVSELTTSVLTSAYATLEWLPTSDESEWEVLYGEANFDPLTQGTAILVSDNPEVTITGLDSETEYEFYVTAVCSMDNVSMMVGPENFTTLCAATTVPYLMDFETAQVTYIPACTTKEKLGVGREWYTSSYGPGFDGNVLNYISHSYNDPGRANSWFYIQGLELEADVTYELSYKYGNNYTSWTESMKVAFGRSPNEAAMTTVLADYPEIRLAHPQVEKIIFSVPSDGIYYFGFNAYSIEDQNRLYVDDISVVVAETCPEPRNLSLSNITASSIDLSWTENGDATAWDIEYGHMGFEQGAGTLISVTSNPYTLQIPTDQEYDFYVRASCDLGENSNWIGPVSYGYCQPFSLDTGAFLTAVSSKGAVTNMGYRTFEPPTDYYVDETAQIFEAYESLTFDIHTSYITDARIGQHSVSVWVDWNNDFEFDEVEELMVEKNDGYLSKILTMTVPEGTPEGSYRLRIRAGTPHSEVFPPPCGGVSSGSVIDLTLKIVTPPACLAPTDIAINDVTDTSINLSWVKHGNATAWEIEYGEPGFELGSGTLVSADTNPFTLNIPTDQEYYFYVRSSCMEGNSSWVGPIYHGYCHPTGGSALSYFNAVSSDGAITNIFYEAENVPRDSYADETQQRFEVYESQTFDILATLEGGNAGVKVWMDWNNDTEFDGVEELVAYESNSSNAIPITIPADTPEGEYRMRIRGVYSSFDDIIPCGHIQYSTTIDFTLTVISEPSCLPPFELTANNPTATTINLGWTERNAATTWNIEYGEAGFTRNSGILEEGITSNPLAVENLEASTEYEFYVQSDCGGNDLSNWAGPYKFSTSCLATSIPYVVDFENATIPNLPLCTSQENMGDGNDWTTTTYRIDGVNKKVLRYSYNDYDADVWFYTQAVELEADVNYQISYKYYGSPSWTRSMKVAYGIAPDATTMTMLLADHPAIVGDGEELIYFNAPSDGIYYFGFHNYSAAEQGYLSLVDIEIKEKPSCMPPSDLMLSNVTTTSLDLSWTENGDATAWEIEYGAPGFEQGTGTLVSADANPYTLDNIATDQEYQFYVRSACDTVDKSEWSDPVELKYCKPTSSYTTDYFSNISSEGAVVDVLYEATTSPIDSYVDQTTLTFEVYESQTFEIHTTYEEGQNGVNIWVDWNKDFEFDEVEELVASEADYSASKTLSVTVPTGTPEGTYRLRVRGELGYRANPAPCGNINYSAAVDFTLTVIPTPSCIAPVDITSANVTDTSVDLGWTENSGATAWNIEYGDAGFEQGTGTLVSADSNPFTLTDLSPSTVYEFYVQSNCQNYDLSDWIGPYSFTTICALATATFTEGFEEGYIDGEPLSGCWSQESVVGSSNWIANETEVTYNRWPRTGNWNAYLGYGNEDWMFYPMYLEEGVAYELSFYATQDKEDGAWVQAGFGTSNSASAMTEFIPETLVHFESYQKYSGVFTPSTSGLHYIGIKGRVNYYARYLSLDDIEVREAPSCLMPSSLNASDITTTTATLGWEENNTATSWNIEYGELGFIQGDGILLEGVTSNAYTLEDLSLNVAYEFYVQSDCGDNDLSEWAGPHGFITTCTPATIPFVEGFETQSSTYGVLSGCWSQENISGGYQWQINTISNSNIWPRSGNSNVFLWGTNEDWMFYPLALEENVTYELSFYAEQNTDNGTWVQAGFGPTNSASAMTEVIPETPVFNYGYQEFAGVFTPETSGVYYVGIKGRAITPVKELLIDDISVKESLSCFKPRALTLNNITSTSVNLSWQGNGSATAWEITYGPVGFEPDTGTIVPANSNSLTLQIPMNQEYHFYVRSSCDATNKSDWLGPIHHGYCLPYSYGLFNYLEEINSTGAITELAYNTTSAPENHYANETEQSFEANASQTFEIATESYNVGFGSTSHLVNIWVDWNQDMEFDESELVASHWGAHLSKTMSVTVPEGIPEGEYRMRILGKFNRGEAPPSCGKVYGISTVDFTLTIVEQIPCSPPTGLNVTNETANSVDVSWTENNEASSWNIEYGEAGFEQGTGTVVSANSNPFTLTGLTENTNYTFYVQSDCGSSGLGDWSTSYDFATETASCEAVTNISVTDISATTATVSWTASATATNGYVIGVLEAGADPDTATAVFSQSLAEGTTSVEVTGLVEESSYDVYIASDCGGSVMTISEVVTFTTTTLICEAVTSISVSNITEFTATVSWTASATAIEGYIVDVYEAGADTSTATAVFTESLIDGTSSIQVSGLVNDTSYDVYITSDCGLEVVVAEVVTFTTEEIEILIDDVEVTEVTPTSAIISWSVPETTTYWYTTNEDVTCAYVVKVYQADMDPEVDDPVFSETVPFGVNQVEVTGLTPDTEYVAYITLECSNGVVVVADIVSFSTKPTAGVTDLNTVEFKFYPNPVGTELNIYASKKINEVQVYSILGQKLLTFKPNVAETTLDVSDLAPATYVLKIKIEDGVHTVHFIKK